MRQSYALIYMSRLASEIAEEDKLTCYSNQTWSRNVVLDRYVDEVDRDHVAENEARLAALSIDTIRIPSHVSLAEILRFRESHEDDLKRYRKEIHGVALQVSAAGTEKFQEREIQRTIEERFRPAEREVMAKLGEAKIDFGTTVMQVSLASATGIALAAGNLTGAFTTLGINLMFSVVKWRTAHARAQKHPLAYLVALRTRFREENT
jgi:hypothetical protein